MSWQEHFIIFCTVTASLITLKDKWDNLGIEDNSQYEYYESSSLDEVEYVKVIPVHHRGERVK